MRIRRITIVNVKKPREVSINEELQWFGHTLGLFGDRDKDKSCFRIFIELIKSIKTENGMTSDELAEKLRLTRATVVHHLNALIERGIIIHHGNKYYLRGERLSLMIEDLQRDIERSMEEMKKAAEELDRILGL